MVKKNRKQEIRKELKKKQVTLDKTPIENEDSSVVMLTEEAVYPEIETFEDIDDELDLSQTIEYQMEAKPVKTSLFSKIKKTFSRDHKVLKVLEQKAEAVLEKEDEISPIPAKRTEEYYNNRPCEEFIKTAAKIIEKMLI